jgi:hypothetical protein
MLPFLRFEESHALAHIVSAFRHFCQLGFLLLGLHHLQLSSSPVPFHLGFI